MEKKQGVITGPKYVYQRERDPGVYGSKDLEEKRQGGKEVMR